MVKGSAKQTAHLMAARKERGRKREERRKGRLLRYTEKCALCIFYLSVISQFNQVENQDYPTQKGSVPTALYMLSTWPAALFFFFF